MDATLVGESIGRLEAKLKTMAAFLDFLLTNAASCAPGGRTAETLHADPERRKIPWNITVKAKSKGVICNKHTLGWLMVSVRFLNLWWWSGGGGGGSPYCHKRKRQTRGRNTRRRR